MCRVQLSLTQAEGRNRPGTMSERKPPHRVCRDLPGWRWSGGKLESLETVDGFLARGATLAGRCKMNECRRSVKVDLQAWSAHRYGGMGLDGLRHAYRCARVGCDFNLEPPSYPSGIPLQCYVGGAERLDVRCKACRAGRPLTAEEMIARLERAGVTYACNVGVRVVASMIQGACKACGKSSWSVEVERPPAPGTPQYAEAHGIRGAAG